MTSEQAAKLKEHGQGFRHTRNVPPTFSVVIPVFNAGKYIAATLQSLVKQKYPAIEVIVVDGESTDGTLDVVQSFTECLEIHLISEPDHGQLDALQKGLLKARGNITYWLNADDICMPGTLHYVASEFAKRPDVDVIYGDDFAFNEPSRGLFVGASIRGLRQIDHALFYRQLYSECVFWRTARTKLLDASYYDLRVYTDYAFFLNQNWGLKMHWVPKRLGAFRIHDAQMSQTQSDRKEREYKRVRADFYRQRGWSDSELRLLRCLRGPSFGLRQIALPFLERASRRLARAMSNDAQRRMMANVFFDRWLGAGESPAELEEHLFR